ncbi:hypothetical protein BCR33DRAFT_724315, partial [Rhizoclosmatium globosum]
MRSQCIPESAAPILKDFHRPIIAYQFLQNYADIKLEYANTQALKQLNLASNSGLRNMKLLSLLKSNPNEWSTAMEAASKDGYCVTQARFNGEAMVHEALIWNVMSQENNKLVGQAVSWIS